MAKRAKTNGAITGLLTNPTRITFGGKTYNLVMTNGVLCEFEQITGLSAFFDTDHALFGQHPKLYALAAMFYCLLKRDGCELTLEQVTDAMLPVQWPEIYRAVLQARKEAYTKEKAASPMTPATISPS